MKLHFYVLAFAALLLPAGASIACYLDADCSVGSTCVMAAGENYGSCQGGLTPGNSNDLRPVHPPGDGSLKNGGNCTADPDCGPESTCIKQIGFIEGVCTERPHPSVPAAASKPI